MPVVNMKPTEGMPTPDAIGKQRAEYLKTLQRQEEAGERALEEQKKKQVAYLREQAEKSKQMYLMKVDQEVEARDMVLNQQYSQQMALLNQQYASQRQAMEQQAMLLTEEYKAEQAGYTVMPVAPAPFAVPPPPFGEMAPFSPVPSYYPPVYPGPYGGAM